MGRDIHILALNPDVGRNSLKAKINKFSTLNNSLFNFITEYDASKVDEYKNLIEIINTDLNLIRIEDLENIYFWYRGVCRESDDVYISDSYEILQRKFEQKIKQLGIELIHEFEGKQVCFHFMFWLGEFEYLNKLGVYNEENNSFLNYEISTDTI